MALLMIILIGIGGVSAIFGILLEGVLSRGYKIMLTVVGLLLVIIGIGYIIENSADYNHDKEQYNYEVEISDHLYYTNEIKSDTCGYYIDDYYVRIFRILGKGDDLGHRDKAVFINRGDTVIDQSIDKDISVDLFCKN
jgi:hypothetical protein